MPSTKVRAEMYYAINIRDVVNEFIVSRQAMGCSTRTVEWYRWTLGKFLEYVEGQEIYRMDQVLDTVPPFLAKLRNQRVRNQRGETVNSRTTLSDRYIHAYARCVRTFLRYSHEHGYIEDTPKIPMPKIRRRKMPVLEVDEISQLLRACDMTRDLLMVTLAIASGIRLAEMCALNWGDIDLKTGVVDVISGKGGKYRAVLIDKETLRTVHQYRIEMSLIDEELIQPDKPLFGNYHYPHGRLTIRGVMTTLVRISKKADVPFSAHSLRRTFAKMATKRGMDIIWIQQLMGHENITTTRDYVQGLDMDDVRSQYDAHAPMSGFLVKRKRMQKGAGNGSKTSTE